MMIKYITVFLLFCCVNLNAQFIKNFDIEVSHGWMKNYNKGEIKSGTSGSALETATPPTEDHLWTNMLSIYLEYEISKKHSVKIGYKTGLVGSILDGRYYSPGFEGPIIIDLMGNHNTIQYRLFGLYYAFLLPIDTDYFLFQIGGSHQENSIVNTFVPVYGILETNYNLSASVGFGHSILKNLDLVPRITVINSFSNKHVPEAPTDSRFVPIQIGFELGFRFRV